MKKLVLTIQTLYPSSCEDEITILSRSLRAHEMLHKNRSEMTSLDGSICQKPMTELV